MSATERLRKQLEVPMSIHGGETFSINLADVRAALNTIDRLRSVLRVQFLRTSPETSHAAIDEFLDRICDD